MSLESNRYTFSFFVLDTLIKERMFIHQNVVYFLFSFIISFFIFFTSYIILQAVSSVPQLLTTMK